MIKIQLAVAALAIAGLAASPFAAQAKTYKHTRHHYSTTTTGANMKSPSDIKGGVKGNTSSEGNAGPGTTHNGTTAGGK